VFGFVGFIEFVEFVELLGLLGYWVIGKHFGDAIERLRRCLRRQVGGWRKIQ